MERIGIPLAWVLSRDADVRRVIQLNLCRQGMCCVDMTTPVECKPHPTAPQLSLLDIDPAAGVDWEMAYSLRRNRWLQGVLLIVIAARMPLAGLLAVLSPIHGVYKPPAVDEILAQVRESLGYTGVP